MENFVFYIVIIAISGLISIANKVKENEKKKKKEEISQQQEMHPVKEMEIKEIEKTDCPFCGALNDKNIRFCLVCGFDIHGFLTEAEKIKKEKEIAKEKIKAKVALISKREEAIKKQETADFGKNKSLVPKAKVVISKNVSSLKVNIKQIFLYKELLDKPLALRKK